MKKNFVITTPRYYANKEPHIGHAYTNIVADTIKKIKELYNCKVILSTGTDEHGIKIEIESKNKNIKAIKYVNYIVKKFKFLNKVLKINTNKFIRTTDKKHIEYVKRQWRKLKDKKLIYLSKYKGWYSVNEETYYEKKQILDKKSPLGNKVMWIEEESYFFKLSKFKKKLLKIYKNKSILIKPRDKEIEVINFIEKKLQDLSISRTKVKWGIRVPNDNKHIIYVWFDALISYISINSENKRKYWPAELQIIGKDIVIFHCIYWPAILIGLDMDLPKEILIHNWWISNKEKISKSRNNSKSINILIKKYSSDYLRYYMLRETNYIKDNEFSEKSLKKIINKELIGKIGNYINRNIIIIIKNYKIISINVKLARKDILIFKYIEENDKIIKRLVNDRRIKTILRIMIKMVKIYNKYVNNVSSWKINEIGNNVRLDSILNIIYNKICIISIMLQPFVPTISKNIIKYLSINKKKIEYIYRRKILKNKVEKKIFFNKIL